MNTYTNWVTDSLAKEAANPARPRLTITTLEFARIQPIGELQPEARAGLVARLLGLLKKSAEGDR